jgi:uracil DNA glycosylase
LAFSVPRDVPVPRTLKNIYQELHDDQGVQPLTRGTSNRGRAGGCCCSTPY